MRRDSEMTERLTDDSVNEHETAIMQAARLAYRIGRQDQQRFVEAACRKQLDDEHLALLLHGLACDFPHEPVSFQAIVWAAEGDSTRLTDAEDGGASDG